MVTETDDIFLPFHSIICNVVQSISESYYCIPKPPTKDNFYLNLWHQCQFTGQEVFSDICHILGDFIRSLFDYVSFIHNIPMLDIFFRYLFYGDQRDACLIGFHMTRTEFKDFTKYTYPIAEKEVDLCAFINSSISICQRCATNEQNLPSDQPHVRNCELLRLLHPESVYTDLVVPSSWTFNTNPGRLAISSSEVSAMYEKSFLLATEFVYRDRQIPFYSVSISSDNNDELQYILMEFRSKTKGHRFSRWITRPNAVKVCNIDCIPCTCINLQFLLTVILFCYHLFYFVIISSIAAQWAMFW